MQVSITFHVEDDTTDDQDTLIDEFKAELLKTGATEFSIYGDPETD